MKPTDFIAKRYLFSRQHVSLISTLTVISVTGVTIGTALLIIVLSVFNGFFDVIKGLLLNNDPDVRIESAEGRSFGYNAQLKQQLADIPEIRIASPYVSGKALMTAGKNRDRVVSVKGVHPTAFEQLSGLSEKMKEGAINLSVIDRAPGILITQTLLSDLELSLASDVALLSAEGMRKSLTQFSVPRTVRFDVRGTYAGIEITETPAAYISLEAAQRLFNLRNTVSGVDLRLSESASADGVKEKLEQQLPAGFKISTWYDLQKPLYDVMYLEKWGAYFVLMIIVLVAVLNIIGSLTMIVIQKNRDIGILLTMGCTPADIRRIFMRQGLYIGAIGCGLGGLLGLLLSWAQQTFGLIKLSSAFIINAYPVSIHAIDVVIVLAGSLLLCLLASWYPSRRAAQVEPADAVRFD